MYIIFVLYSNYVTIYILYPLKLQDRGKCIFVASLCFHMDWTLFLILVVSHETLFRVIIVINHLYLCHCFEDFQALWNWPEVYLTIYNSSKKVYANIYFVQSFYEFIFCQRWVISNSPFRLTSLIYAEKFEFHNLAIMEDKQYKQTGRFSVMTKGRDYFLSLDDNSK